VSCCPLGSFTPVLNFGFEIQNTAAPYLQRHEIWKFWLFSSRVHSFTILSLIYLLIWISQNAQKKKLFLTVTAQLTSRSGSKFKVTKIDFLKVGFNLAHICREQLIKNGDMFCYYFLLNQGYIAKKM